MENAAATDDTPGRDCKGGSGRTAAQDSVHSGVTEVGSSGNAAAAEEARRPSLGEDYGWLTVLENKAADDYDEPVEAETMVDGGDVPSSSPVRHAAARFGWLLLGFLAGAAATALFLMGHDDSPVTTCTVVPT